jgi:Zn-finger nucleic acid-binding protein
MKCPRCPDSTLEEREREGVTVDACRSCYGIWLDRGELERLIARARDEIEQLERRDERTSRTPEDRQEPRYESRRDSRYDSRDERHRERRDDDDDRHRRHDGRYGHKRKRWFDALGDIFD